MKILRLAVIEIKRKPQKNGLLVLAIVMAVSLLIALSIVSNSANATILEVISKTGHTLTVRPAISVGEEGKGGMAQNPSTSEVVLGKYIPESALPKIEKVYDKAILAGWEKKGGLVKRPGVGEIDIEPPTWAPRLYEKAEVEGSEIIITGVDFYKEYFVRFWWKLSSGEWPTDSTLLRQTGEDEALVGGSYARARGSKVGDTIPIKGREFKVMGILEETNSADDYMIFIPLITAQRLFDRKGVVSLLSVRAMCPNCPVGDAMVEMNKEITGITATSQLDIAGVQFEFFNMLYKFLLAIVVATIVVGVFSIFNVVTGSLYARVKEIGLLKAIGASRFQLFRIFLYEHLIVGLAAGVAGYLLGVGMAYLLNKFLGMGAVIRLSPEYIWVAIALGVFCSLAAIIYPAYKLSRTTITEIFKTQWET
ncbi:MAG: ABC transporter permease [Nitrospirota bacterium]|jgi:putative ABC transport system permease protein